MRRIQDVGLMLGKIMESDTMPNDPLAMVDRQNAGQDLQQRALAYAIVPKQCHTLATLDAEGERAVHRLGPVALADPPQIEDQASAGRRFGEAEANALGVTLAFDLLHPLELLQTRLHLTSLGGFGAKAVHKALHPSDLAFLREGGCLQLRFTGSPGLQIALIVANIGADRVPVDLPDVRHDAVEERRIMADHQDRRARSQEKLLKPC